MSRRKLRADEVDQVYVSLRLHCPAGHQLGLIVRQRGRDIIGAPLERVDGPNGETKVRGVCAVCHTDSQMRWDRLQHMLDQLDKTDNYCDVTMR